MRGHGRHGAPEPLLELGADSRGKLRAHLLRHALKRRRHIGREISLHVGAHDLLQALRHGLARDLAHLLEQRGAALRRIARRVRGELLHQLLAEIGVGRAKPLAIRGQPRRQEPLDELARKVHHLLELGLVEQRVVLQIAQDPLEIGHRGAGENGGEVDRPQRARDIDVDTAQVKAGQVEAR